MSGKKNPTLDPVEFEKLRRQLDQFRVDPEKPIDDGGWFNPWNLSPKKPTGRRTICASLPEELPE